MKTYDIALIGGGIVGAAIARELSRYRVRVVLLEKEAELAFGVSKSNSGIIHPGTQNPPDSLKGKLCVEGNRLIRILARELGVDFKEVGELICAFSDADVARLEKLKKEGEALNVPRLAIVDRHWLRTHEPNLSPAVIAALYAPTAGIISPYRWVYDFAENAMRNGVDIFTEAPVKRIEVQDGHRFVLATPLSTFHASWVVNAAGLHADIIARMMGITDFKITPRKGEEFLLDKKREYLSNHLLFPLPEAHSKGILVIKTSDGNPMIGPTARPVDAKNDHTTTDEGLEAVLASVRRLIPAVDARDIIAYFAGVRPAAGDDFIIRHEQNVPGCITVAGIQSPGLTAAPAIARMVIRLLTENGCVLKKKLFFHRHRKKTTHLFAIPFSKTARLIKKNPAYGDVVCRCEMVSAQEIREAIARGAQTLDGIKFRTRAQAGRCHGSFCTARIMNILAAERGIPVTAVTKRGAGSEIVKGDRRGSACGERRVYDSLPAVRSSFLHTATRELVIVGGGPAGMAAACAASEHGVRDILILEREAYLGGILNQCIHTGFGLTYFKEILTGPEYAQRFIKKVQTLPGVEIRSRSFVVDLTGKRVMTVLRPGSLETIRAKALIMATGCRERTREMIHIAGTRPAGIFSAGLAQKLINIEGLMPGFEVVIVGSGDIGLIMARRFMLEGAHVKAVIEIQPKASGLTRNVVQCLDDFDIPLYLQHRMAGIYGENRVERVVVEPVDDAGMPIPDRQFEISCDTVLVSAGLIPENELVEMAGAQIDKKTNTPTGNDVNTTSIPGIFVCGNAAKVYDVVDSVTRDSERAGQMAAAYLNR